MKRFVLLAFVACVAGCITTEDGRRLITESGRWIVGETATPFLLATEDGRSITTEDGKFISTFTASAVLAAENGFVLVTEFNQPLRAYP